MPAARMTAEPEQWIACKDELPPIGEVVITKIDDEKGVRNIEALRRTGRLWFMHDGSMYVYYTPTHWKPLPRKDSPCPPA